MCKCLNLDSFLLHSQERRAENKLLQPKGRKERKKERRKKRNKKENKKKMKKTNLKKLWNYKKMMMKKKTMMKVKNKCFYEQCSCGMPPLTIKVKESVWKLVSGIWQCCMAKLWTPAVVYSVMALISLFCGFWLYINCFSFSGARSSHRASKCNYYNYNWNFCNFNYLHKCLWEEES